jgi:hypothetical protein
MKTFVKENWCQIMGKLLLFSFLLLFTSCGADEPKPNPPPPSPELRHKQPPLIKSPQTETVFLCEGEFAQKYHNKSNCTGLNNCKADVTPTNIGYAISQGRSQCDVCY